MLGEQAHCSVGFEDDEMVVRFLVIKQPLLLHVHKDVLYEVVHFGHTPRRSGAGLKSTESCGTVAVTTAGLAELGVHGHGVVRARVCKHQKSSMILRAFWILLGYLFGGMEGQQVGMAGR